MWSLYDTNKVLKSYLNDNYIYMQSLLGIARHGLSKRLRKMNLWGNEIRIVACIKKNTGKYMLMGNVPDRKEFRGNFASLELAKSAKEAAMKIEGGPRSYSGFYKGGVTWEAEEVA